MMRAVSLVVLAGMLAGCAGTPSVPRERIERALAKAPGVAQPTKVVATELAFARMAQEEGQWTAFREFAAPGAIIHGRAGTIAAEAFLSGRKDPEEAVRWSPDTVWMSCDSTLAVSEGRFKEPDGMVGTFMTVWQLQSNREYRYIYDVALRDDPQPAPRVESEPIDDDAIIVEAMESIRGLVADCPKRGESPPQQKPNSVRSNTQLGGGRSADGTLYWEWYQFEDGSRRFISRYSMNGDLQLAGQLDMPASSTPE